MSFGDGQEPSDGFGGTGHTRTRLPEGGGDVYGGARRGGRSSSRSLITVVGVIVLLIAAIAFANRGGDDSSSTDGAGSQPEAASTAASGEKPVQAKAGGIPSGFAQDEVGAQSAAANYAVTLGSTGMFNKGTRHSIVDAIYTPPAATKLQGAMDQAYSADFLGKLGLDAEGRAPEGSTFVSRTVPVGTKVQQFSDSSAKVAVWYMGLIGMSGEGSTDPVSSTWKTWTFDLQWTDGDWKIASDAQTDGPAPVPGDDRAASSDEISKAIEEYGGFTYAR
ncbi:hypothetical protein ABT063_37515 [Streptomyces sp. NPDC002838]|uniref:hypothetical protein n=1 Tax=Streptomyces sp. NPDC002838 TaxID=3154436 RepID=UPI00331B4026